LRLAFSELSPCRVIVLEENIPPALRPLVVALCGAQIRVELVNARGVIMLA
jgi:hypothetical protein